MCNMTSPQTLALTLSPAVACVYFQETITELAGESKATKEQNAFLKS